MSCNRKTLNVSNKRWLEIIHYTQRVIELKINKVIWQVYSKVSYKYVKAEPSCGKLQPNQAIQCVTSVWRQCHFVRSLSNDHLTPVQCLRPLICCGQFCFCCIPHKNANTLTCQGCWSWQALGACQSNIHQQKPCMRPIMNLSNKIRPELMTNQSWVQRYWQMTLFCSRCSPWRTRWPLALVPHRPLQSNAFSVTIEQTKQE